MRLLALDGGGSKTVCLIADELGRVRGWGSGGPSNLSFVSPEAAGAAIGGAIEAALRRAGVAGAGEPAVDVALCSGPVRPTFLEEAVRRVVRCAAYRLAPEADACLASAGAEFGALVLAGTGSFEYARGHDGRAHRCDGWGTLFGDEGSAYDIARRALIAVARAEDGRGPQTALREAVLAHFGVDSFRAVSRRIYEENLPREQIARLAPLVAPLADVDEAARALLRDAAEALARGVLTCLAATGLGAEDFTLALCGGAFRAGRALIEPLLTAVQAVAPGALPVRPRFEPVYGALRLAFRCATLDWNDAHERAFADSVAESAQAAELAALVCAG
ncbi:MAG TPA: BadF/BadG/BcrA/BcrD ATPase family protein [Dehalococcoidia bacterium]|nr:BadF/BadG/BcrA/BcrD ATPase family protein [Dehalococcoidia bacterium]